MAADALVRAPEQEIGCPAAAARPAASCTRVRGAHRHARWTRRLPGGPLRVRGPAGSTIGRMCAVYALCAICAICVICGRVICVFCAICGFCGLCAICVICVICVICGRVICVFCAICGFCGLCALCAICVICGGICVICGGICAICGGAAGRLQRAQLAARQHERPTEPSLSTFGAAGPRRTRATMPR